MFQLRRSASALACVLGFVMVGCGGGGGDSSALPPSEGVPRDDPNPRPAGALVMDGVTGIYGGRYVSAVRMDPKTWNALLANEASSNTFLTGPLSEALATFNYTTQEYEPGLVTAWESNEQGTEWTFHWREGMRWSDGAPHTIDDVLFTMEVVYDDDVHPSVAELCKVNGEPFTLRKVDDLTFTVSLPAPYGAFLDAFSSVRIMPKHILEESFRSGNFSTTFGIDTRPEDLVFNGPWKLGRHVPQEKVVLVPNPHCFRYDSQDKRLPYLDELVYVVVPDQNAELLKFQSGETDEVYFRAEDYAALKDGEASGNYTIYDMGQEMGTMFVWFNQNGRKNPDTGKPYVDPVKLSWFTDLDFRIAISHCIDRDGMVRNVFYGVAEPLYSSMPPANKKWHNPDINRYPYDLDEADRRFTAAGYIDRDGDGIREDENGNKVSFTLVTNSDNRERQGLANMMKDDLARAGIEMNVNGMEFNALIQRLRDTYEYDAMLLGLTGGVPPSPFTSANVWKSSGRTHFWNPQQETPATEWEAELDRLMDLVVGAPSPDAAREPWFQLQKVVSEQQAATYLVSRRGLIAVRDNFVGLEPSVLRPWVLWQSYTISYDPARAKADRARRGE